MTLITDHNSDTVREKTSQANEDLTLSSKHQALFQQFKKSVEDAIRPGYRLHTDSELVKFCYARKWDLKKSEAMFRQAVKLRETMRLDQILDEYEEPEVIEKYLTGGIGCFDKEGYPVRFERFGSLDIKGIFYSCRKSDLEKKKLHDQELAGKIIREQSEKLGKKIDRLTVVMDLDQVGSKHLWRPGLVLYLHLVKLLEDNYPEFVKNLIVVNAPKIFPIFFKICRPLISEDMNKKLRVYGTNFLPEVLKVISEEELPAFLGGKQVGPDNDKFCTHKIKAGGLVPESYYLKDLIDTTEFESTTIAAGCKLVLKIPIDQPNCVIRWEFLTQGKDISFGVNIITKGSEKQQTVVPCSRVQSHMVPEDGTITCEQLGTYVVIFDNSYSWTKSKKLKYSLEALIEDEELMQEVSHVMNHKLD